MLRGFFGLLCLASLVLPFSVHSQSGQVIPGWEIVPDSLMQVWHLDKDQIRRIRVIEEDYSAEREEVWSTPNVEEKDKVQELGKLGVARMEEIKGVLGTVHYGNWQEVLHPQTPDR